MSRNIIGAILLFCLTSCGTIMAPNPTYVSQINSYFSAAEPVDYAATEKFQRPIAYQVGQYIVTGTTYNSERSVEKMAIVGKEGDAWLIETYSLTQNSESTTQMLVKGMDTLFETGDIHHLDFIWIKIKPNGEEVQTIEGPMLTMTKGIYKKVLSRLENQLQMNEDGGTVQVPAGNFNGTVKAGNDSSFMGKKYHADIWLHPAVPINGVVKSIVTDDSIKTELLDFGLSGAKRSF